MNRLRDKVKDDQGDIDYGDTTDAEGMSLSDIACLLRSRLVLLIIGPIAFGALALGITMFIPPTFTANTTFIPPQQAQSTAVAALASLGSLGGLAGNVGGIASLAERYAALMRSQTLSDRIIDQFKLMDTYDVKFRMDARKELADNVRITLGKKDGLMTVEVDDKSPQRAADMANRYIDELRRIADTLAVTEAQQRRAFFEGHLKETKDRLVQAQRGLEASGYNPGALKAEPKVAAEAYARLKAEATAADLRLGLLRSRLADGTPEVMQQQATLSALRKQLATAESTTNTSNGVDYIGRYREFKYQETLFEVYARQFELARADESREGGLIQVVDRAMKPELKSRPKRAIIAVSTGLATLFILIATLLLSHSLKMRPAGISSPIG